MIYIVIAGIVVFVIIPAVFLGAFVAGFKEARRELRTMKQQRTTNTTAARNAQIVPRQDEW